MRTPDDVMEEAVEITYDKESLPEAPASANIKVWIDGYGVMFTTRANKMKDVVNHIDYLIETAKVKGWKHTWDTTPVPSKPITVNQDTKLCGVHGTPMEFKQGVSKKTNKPYAFWGCPQKNADGTFCQYRP